MVFSPPLPVPNEFSLLGLLGELSVALLLSLRFLRVRMESSLRWFSGFSSNQMGFLRALT